ncbi:MAG: methionine--tRNA ligase, partial [Bacteroidota bacterium]
AREFFIDLKQKGFLIDLEEEQYFDEKAQMFLPDRYVEGICPNCGHDHARGDQCDSCGAYYDQLKLKNPVSLVSGDTPVVKKTTHWYMRFDKFQGFLEKYIESHSGDWKDNVLQQSRSWLKQGLAQRAITRDLTWGVKIDNIPDVPESKSAGKVLYVWFEAVLGYISATKELMLELSQEGKASPEDWKNWWQSEGTKYVAFIGKDNIVFHTLIFPAILNARGDNYILPDNVPANEFLNLEGQKFSKSRNWSIDLRDFINDFPDPSHIDALRYTLAMSLPETKDADFTWKDFQARTNNELTAIFGNFVNRTMQFADKNFAGKIPVLPEKYKWLRLYWKNLITYFEASTGDLDTLIENVPDELRKILSDNDINLIYALWNGKEKTSDLYERFKFKDGITETMNIARAANKYFNDEEPWKTIKDDKDTTAKTIYICLQLVHSLATLFAPFVPHTSKKIFEFFGSKPHTGKPNFGFTCKNFWDETPYPTIEEGLKFKTPELLFSKIEDETIEQQIAKLGHKTEKAVDETEIPLITIDDFQKIKFTTGRIISAEKIEKSQKLLKLKVDIGVEHRQIVAGISEHYKPEELIGKVALVLVNLKPVKIMGVESQGMMIAASNLEGTLSLLVPEKSDVGISAEVR